MIKLEDLAIFYFGHDGRLRVLRCPHISEPVGVVDHATVLRGSERRQRQGQEDKEPAHLHADECRPSSQRLARLRERKHLPSLHGDL
jgi:hypothetical protein